MTIWRGTGGGGNATTDSEVTLLTQLEQSATQAAADAAAAQAAALLAASEAAASASSIEGDVASAEAARIAAQAAQEASEDARDASVVAQGLAEDARDAALAAEAALENVYTKDEADDLLDLKANQATTYTKTEVDSSLATKQAADTELTTLSGMSANRATFLASEQAFSFRNRLINANPIINQRGYVSGTATTTANQYTLDRWRVVVSGQNVSWTDSGLTRTLTCPAGGFEQVIESLNIEGGTFVLNWTGTATATVNGTAVGKGGTFTLPANTNATVRFSGGTLAEPQLEAGSVATPFERRDYGLELMMCQRYCTDLTIDCVGYQLATGPILISMSLPTTMRTTPTVVQIANNVSFTQSNVTATTSSYIASKGHISAYRNASTTNLAQFSEIARLTTEL